MFHTNAYGTDIYYLVMGSRDLQDPAGRTQEVLHSRSTYPLTSPCGSEYHGVGAPFTKGLAFLGTLLHEPRDLATARGDKIGFMGSSSLGLEIRPELSR